ncbi:hypothetical protein [Mucilaginibacter lacusdianchii]|uniref:hypothetical protein n=1 Tax=Mucilaginibacter lacusdianchii TaxID=2684211 RepID=UPI00131C47C2|nr:hypothetical protein [Mucilaginibacter sp. JXJ CY 39]
MAEITMPSAPNVKNIKHGKVYVIVKDSCAYFAQASELKNEDYFHQIDYNNLDQVYDGYVEGALKSTNGTLWAKRPAPIADELSGYEFEYEPQNGDPFVTRYQRVVLINSTLVSYGIWFTNKRLDTHANKRDAFYKSFHITSQPPPTQSVRPGTPLNLSSSFYLYIAGGFVLTFFIIIGLAYAFKRPRIVK